MDDEPDELHRVAAETDGAQDTEPSAAKTTEPSAAEAVEPALEAEPAVEDVPAGKRTKAERLEAKAARLRETEQRRAEERAAAAAAQAAAGYGRPASRGPGWIVAVSVLSVVSVGLLTVLIIGFISWQHQRDINSARADVQKLAKQYALDFGTYDYQHLDADFKKVEAHLTASFKKSYATSSAGLAPTVVQYKGKAVATVQGVGVTSVSQSKATVVILLDQTVTTSQSSTPRIDRNRLVMKLVHQHGTWLIESLNSP